MNCVQPLDYSALGSSRKLGRAAENLVEGSEKRICWLSFESVRVCMPLKGAAILGNGCVLFTVELSQANIKPGRFAVCW